MRKLDVSAISTTNAMEHKSGIFTHIQNAILEGDAAAIIALIGVAYDPTKAYVLTGCINTGSGAAYVISAGIIFFAGEVYYVDAASFTITGSNVAVGTITLSYYSATEADPVDFTDGTPRNIHQIRKIVFAPALSGSGASDYTAVLFTFGPSTINFTGSNEFTITGTYPSYTLNAPGKAVIRRGLTNVGDISAGGTTISLSWATIGTTAYIVIATLESFGTATQDATVIFAVKNTTKSATGVDVIFMETGNITQNVKLAWAVILI